MSQLKINIHNVKRDKSTNDYQWPVIDIEVHREINRIPYAVITLVDGNIGKDSDFEVSSSDFFDIGEEISIKVEKEQGGLEFKGIVSDQKISMDEEQGLLIVTVKHKAYRLTGVRRNRIYDVRPIEGQVNVKQRLVQHYCSNWDYLVCLADLYGGWIVTKSDELFIVYPDRNGSVYSKTFKKKVYNDHSMNMTEHQNLITNDITFSINESSLLEFKEAKYKKEESKKTNSELVLGYGNKNKVLSFEMKTNTDSAYKTISSNQGKYNLPIDDSLKGYIWGGFESDKLKDIGRESFDIYLPTYNYNPELHHMSKESHRFKAQNSFLTGTFTLIGQDYSDVYDFKPDSPIEKDIFIGRLVNVSNISKRFDGKKWITSIYHKINSDGWILKLGFGACSRYHKEKFPDVSMHLPAQLPTVEGIQLGVVKEDSVATQKHVLIEFKDFGSGFDDKSKKVLYANKLNTKDDGSFPTYKKTEKVLFEFVNNDSSTILVLGKYNHISSNSNHLN